MGTARNLRADFYNPWVESFAPAGGSGERKPKEKEESKKSFFPYLFLAAAGFLNACDVDSTYQRPYVDSVEWGLREIYGLIFIILELKVSPLQGALGKGSQRGKRSARQVFSLISSLLQLASSLLWEAS